MRAPKKPAKFGVGRICVRAIRGPHREDPTRWYWRAEAYEGDEVRTVHTGWATRVEVEAHLIGMAHRGELAPEAEAPTIERLATVRDLLETWVASLGERHRVGDLSAHGHSGYLSAARRVLTRLAKVRLEDLDAATVEGYRLARLATGAPSTVRQDLKALRTAWRWAREHGHGVDRDFPSVRRFGKLEPVRNHRTPDEVEARKVMTHLTGWRRLAFLVMLATGARIGEVAALTWGDVDLVRGTVAFRGKTGLRVVPVRPELVEALRSWPRVPTSDRILPVTANMVTGHLVGDMADACRKAGVPVFTPHGLRRLMVDHLRRSGVAVEAAAALMGHSVVVMLTLYREVSMDDMRAAIGKLSPALPEVAPGTRPSGARHEVRPS